MGHKGGRCGHEFLEFEFKPDGTLYVVLSHTLGYISLGCVCCVRCCLVKQALLATAKAWGSALACCAFVFTAHRVGQLTENVTMQRVLLCSRPSSLICLASHNTHYPHPLALCRDCAACAACANP